eukprot:jgi/Chlat1/8099/Chrsp75S07552
MPATCKLCREVPVGRACVVAPCGHLLCEACALPWIAARAERCPACRAPLNEQGFIRISALSESSAPPTDLDNGANSPGAERVPVEVGEDMQVQRLLGYVSERWQAVVADKSRMKVRVVELERDNQRLAAELQLAHSENTQLLQKLRIALASPVGSPQPPTGAPQSTTTSGKLSTSRLDRQDRPPRAPSPQGLSEGGEFHSNGITHSGSYDRLAANAVERSSAGSPDRLERHSSSSPSSQQASPPDWELVRTFDTHAEPIHGIAVHPSLGGNLVATASWDHTCKVYDLNQDDVCLVLQGHSMGLYAARFAYGHPTLLGTVSSDQTCRLWSLDTGGCIQVLAGHQDEVNSLSFHRNAYHLLATGSDDKTGAIWDAETGQVVCRLIGHTEPVYGVCFSPQGSIVATVSFDWTVRLWDANTGGLVHVLKGQHTDDVIGVDLDNSGRWMATGSDDATCRVWDTRRWAEVAVLREHGGEVKRVAFAPSSQMLATTSGDTCARLFDTSTFKCTQVLRSHTDHVFDAAWGPDSSYLVTGSHDRTWKLWRPRHAH